MAAVPFRSVPMVFAFALLGASRVPAQAPAADAPAPAPPPADGDPAAPAEQPPPPKKFRVEDLPPPPPLHSLDPVEAKLPEPNAIAVACRWIPEGDKYRLAAQGRLPLPDRTLVRLKFTRGINPTGVQAFDELHSSLARVQGGLFSAEWTGDIEALIPGRYVIWAEVLDGQYPDVAPLLKPEDLRLVGANYVPVGNRKLHIRMMQGVTRQLLQLYPDLMTLAPDLESRIKAIRTGEQDKKDWIDFQRKGLFPKTLDALSRIKSSDPRRFYFPNTDIMVYDAYVNFSVLVSGGNLEISGKGDHETKLIYNLAPVTKDGIVGLPLVIYCDGLREFLKMVLESQGELESRYAVVLQSPEKKADWPKWRVNWTAGVQDVLTAVGEFDGQAWPEFNRGQKVIAFQEIIGGLLEVEQRMAEGFEAPEGPNQGKIALGLENLKSREKALMDSVIVQPVRVTPFGTPPNPAGGPPANTPAAGGGAPAGHAPPKRNR